MPKYMIETQRLGMRLFKKEDLDYLDGLNSDQDVRQFFPSGVQNRAQTEARMNQFISQYEKTGLPSFVMFKLESGEFVGRTGFNKIETGEIEVGYLLQKKFWGKGYATEALIALLDWAKKNIKEDYIIAFAPIEHAASLRVMEKSGMEHYKNGKGHDVECSFYRIKNR